MATKISKLESGLLSANYILYKILKSSTAPVWWKKVKRDKELYIEIRKKNIIDIYYRGGRMAELKMESRENRSKGTSEISQLDRRR